MKSASRPTSSSSGERGAPSTMARSTAPGYAGASNAGANTAVTSCSAASIISSRWARSVKVVWCGPMLVVNRGVAPWRVSSRSLNLTRLCMESSECTATSVPPRTDASSA